MRYWRDPDTMDVIKANDDAPADPGDVVVVPLSKWRRMREIVCELSFNSYSDEFMELPLGLAIELREAITGGFKE